MNQFERLRQFSQLQKAPAVKFKDLEAAVNSHQVKSLIIVAPPRALGVMRQHYGHALKGAVRAELDKDYVKMPVHEIEKHLTAA